MCNSCEKISRRTFTKTGVSAAALALAGVVTKPSLAKIPGFSMPGELTPSFKKAKWVTELNQSDLDAYAHGAIKYIAYHHEGFADDKQSVFDATHARKFSQSAFERTYIMHNEHVKKRYGMIAYHYAVSPSGQIVKGRPLQYAPATGSTDPRTGGIANFDGHFAVVAMEDFEFQKISDREKQIFSMITVMSAAQRVFRVPSKNIRPHKDHVTFNGEFGSTCPGKNLYKIRDKILEMTLAVSLQSELSNLGCYKGAVDGLFGRMSRKALATLSAANRDFGPLSFSDKTLWLLLDKPPRTCV